MSAEDEIENVIEISTLSDEEVVLNWAARGKISQDAIEKLFKEGFTSMEAMLLLEDEDLARTKIPRGQQKLILAAVRKLLKSTERAGDSAHVQTEARVGDDVTGDSLSRGTRSTRDLGSSQSAQGGSQHYNMADQLQQAIRTLSHRYSMIFRRVNLCCEIILCKLIRQVNTVDRD